MPESETKSNNSNRGHPLPRRTSPANSVTLKHHRLARDASLRASAGSGPADNTNSNSNSNSSPRRNSSGESHDTGRSDPRKWFDQSNQNPTATFDNNVMDVDPPFFQKESDSSNEGSRPFQFQQQQSAPRLLPAQSSSADDYRSVIDDLTVEIQKLKEELKRYKQKGPDLLRKEKLFEIKIHGLPKRKKRELETTLRDFAASLDGSPDASSSQQRKSRHANRDNMYGGSGSMSKHASSSSGSNARPVDSAYASMSTGPNSSGTSLGRPSMSLRSRSSEQKVQNYLRDIPEGLYPRQTVMTDKEKKKLVVRRLEQLFTGKITGRGIRRILPPPPAPGAAIASTANSNNEENDTDALAPVTLDAQGQQQSTVHQPPGLVTVEPVREARILSTEQHNHASRKKSQSRDNGSSNSNGDQTEGNSSGGTNTSPSQPAPPEQRPTRPKDLDPDRVQVPSENMDYIRHLGLVPPELVSDAAQATQDVHPDAEGWVYLNLLCNLAQLHIINVTPSFVRSAVSEFSTKFQLSPDGRKIRWRGGSEGTRFSSESSGDNSQRSADTEDTDTSNNEKSRKRQKTKSSGGDKSSGSSGKHPSKFGPQVSGSSESFHYKPLFVQQDSSGGNSSPEDTLSSFGPIEDSQVGDSGWGQSRSGTSNRRKRRHDGAIIYYSGAPFCTDLSGDPGDISPTTYMMSSGQAQQEEAVAFERPLPFRSASGSSLDYRPLSDYPLGLAEGGRMDVDGGVDPGLTSDTGDDASELDWEMPWADDQQYIEVRPLEPCGLGGVLPDDHFMVVVTTARPKFDSTGAAKDCFPRASTEEATDGIISRLASMSTSSPKPLSAGTPVGAILAQRNVEIHYVSGRIKRLAPVPLPPPAIFFPPFSTDTSSSDEEGMSVDMDDESSSVEGLMSRQANPHQSDGYPDGVDLSSGDEDGEDPDDEPDAQRMYDLDAADDGDEVKSGSALVAAGTAPRDRSKSVNPGGSSAATAGGVPSAFSSSDEDK